MSKNTYVCRYCKERVPKDEAVNSGKRSYYHPDCLAEKESEEALKEKETEEYKELIEYICKLYNIKQPTGFMLKQIKDMKNNLGYKYSGIKLSLEYFHEIENNPVLENAGIGIVTSVYEKAKNHYISRIKVKRSLENYSNDEREVIVDLSKKRKQNKKVIDISDL